MKPFCGGRGGGREEVMVYVKFETYKFLNLIKWEIVVV